MADPTAADAAVAVRRRAIVDRPWTAMRQVHGARVLEIDRPGAGLGEAADAAVSDVPGVALAVLTADCAPVGLVSAEGVIGVAHAGWRGLVAGVIEAAVEAMRGLGATEIGAVVGPCIHPECYPFGAADLDAVAVRLGPVVRADCASGGEALDLPAAVRTSLERSGAQVLGEAGVCTACSPAYWSWRGGRDPQRQALVVWRR
ncbi:MAG TPA: polyphenol oxidase family protein [Acidimicrobiales bacterium]